MTVSLASVLALISMLMLALFLLDRLNQHEKKIALLEGLTQIFRIQEKFLDWCACILCLLNDCNVVKLKELLYLDCHVMN